MAHRSSKKRRLEAGGFDQRQYHHNDHTYEETTNNNINNMGGSPNTLEQPKRLSRHIPDRESMDHDVASFTLTESMTVSTTYSCSRSRSWDSPGEQMVANSSGVGLGSAGQPAAGGAQLDNSTSSATYRDVLADSLSNGASKIAGEQSVLTFGKEKIVNLNVNNTNRAGDKESSKRIPRVVNSNPERVLDAPDLPKIPAQLLDWGSNNKVIIGLRSNVYCWDGDNGESSRLVALQPEMSIRCLSWLPKGPCCALTLTDGTSYFWDNNQEKFLRMVKAPGGEAINCTAFHGSLMAAASAGPSGQIFIFDLRQKEALVNTFEADRNEVTALSYCNDEPHYLASGGADGTVKVWDGRFPGGTTPRYAFFHQHRSPVSSLLWNPEKRSYLYSGGLDGYLFMLNTHAAVADGSPTSRTTSNVVERYAQTNSPVTGILSPKGTMELLSAHGDGGGHLQLRKSKSFNPIGQFSAPTSTEAITCVTCSPDHQTVCAAQDETLKFWKVFDQGSSRKRAGASGSGYVSGYGLDYSAGGSSHHQEHRIVKENAKRSRYDLENDFECLR